MKVVLSTWGWGLSKKAYKRIAELMGIECHFYRPTYFDELTFVEVPYDEVEDMYEVHASSVSDANTFTKMWVEYMKDMSIRRSNELYRTFINPDFSWDYGKRNDPILVQVAEELGQELMAMKSHIPRIVEIPDDVEWQIESDEGHEWIAEKHRTWR